MRMAHSSCLNPPHSSADSLHSSGDLGRTVRVLWWADTKEVIYMYDIGEKPGVGRYCCTNCGWSVNVDDASDRLPPCGSCGKGQHTQYNPC